MIFGLIKIGACSSGQSNASRERLACKMHVRDGRMEPHANRYLMETGEGSPMQHTYLAGDDYV